MQAVLRLPVGKLQAWKYQDSDYLTPFPIKPVILTKNDIYEDSFFNTVKGFAAGHPIFDIKTKKNTNTSLKENEWFVHTVHIGDLVWIGIRNMILGTASIGNGSIVGVQSFVKGSFPNNTVIAGTPAKIIHKKSMGTKAHV